MEDDTTPLCDECIFSIRLWRRRLDDTWPYIRRRPACKCSQCQSTAYYGVDTAQVVEAKLAGIFR